MQSRCAKAAEEENGSDLTCSCTFLVGGGAFTSGRYGMNGSTTLRNSRVMPTNSVHTLLSISPALPGSLDSQPRSSRLSSLTFPPMELHYLQLSPGLDTLSVCGTLSLIDTTNHSFHFNLHCMRLRAQHPNNNSNAAALVAYQLLAQMRRHLCALTVALHTAQTEFHGMSGLQRTQQ